MSSELNESIMISIVGYMAFLQHRGRTTLKLGGAMAPTNFSNISFLPPNLLIKKNMVDPPNFLNIIFLPLNLLSSKDMKLAP